MTEPANWTKYIGLPSNELIVLVNIDMNEPIKAPDLVRLCLRCKELSQATVYNILKRLEASGFIKRWETEGLHGHADYSMTKEGHTIHKQATKCFKDFGKMNGLIP